MAAAVGTLPDTVTPRPDVECPGTAFGSDDDGEQSDSTRSDSTRVPSAPSHENPKTRWADILSDDEEPSDCSPPALPSASPDSATAVRSQEREAQEAWGPALASEKEAEKTKRQRAKVWTEKKPATKGYAASSSEWPQSSGDDYWWSYSSYDGTWESSWSEWWEPADAYVVEHRDGWSRGERNAAGARRWSRSRGCAVHRASTYKKPQCQFLIGIEEEPKFHVVRRVLGPRGKHMKDIAERTGAKLRLRGRGSNFLEGPEQQESADPLMLCVSAPDGLAYDEAKRLTQELIEGVYAEYCGFCTKAGMPVPDLCVSLHEGPREGAY